MHQPPGLSRKGFRISSLLLLIPAALLLGTTIYLGTLALRQIRSLETNVQVTESIIDANVRTLGQVQRELLRLKILLQEDDTEPAALQLQWAFVAQRMQEATLAYQLQALGTEALLQQARQLSARWNNEAVPLLEQVVADPATADQELRQALIETIDDLELGFNDLVAQGEINRKQQAGQANDAAVSFLNNARILVTGLGFTLIGFLLFAGISVIGYARFDRQREATARDLVRLNTELRRLSEVASRTDNAVIITDAAGYVEWVNPAFTRLTEYPPEEVLGQHPVSLLRGPGTDATALETIERQWQLGEGFRLEARGYTRSGRDYWAALEGQPVHDEQGRLANFIAVITDLSSQKRREQTIAKTAQLLDIINRAQRDFILTSSPGPLFETLLLDLLDLTDSEYGFIGEVLVDEQGAPYLKTHAITNIAWNEETRAFYDQHAPTGMVFHNLNTLFGAAMTSQAPVIANDPARDPRRGGLPEGHPALNAFLGLPFFTAGHEMTGMVGIANRPQGYDEQLVGFLQPFLATCGNLIEAHRNEQRRQKAEQDMRQLNEQLEERTLEATEQRDFALQIMNTMGQGLTVVDEEGRFTFVNPAFAQMVSDLPENLIGRRPGEFTADEDRPVLFAAGAARQQGHISTYETRIRSRDGQLLDALVTGVPRYRHGEFAGSIAVITNLTEQKRVEAALRRSESEARKLSQVASRTDNLVIIADAEGTVEWVNDAFTRVTGYSLEETVGRRPGEMLQGSGTDPQTVAFMRRRLQRGEGFNAEVLNYAKSGRQYWVAIEVQPVHDEQGRLTNFIAVETDITERRQAEAHLRQAKEAAEQSARAKAAFLANMSHEIRTPLNAVIGLTGLLLNTPLTPLQQEYAETARGSGNLLLMLINDILDFSALEAGRVALEQRPFDLPRLLQETVGLLEHEARRRRLNLTYQVATDLPQVFLGDDTRLRQVLVNLIGNALKFTQEGGVTVTVAAPDQTAGVTQLEFAVADTGIGIPAHRLDRLFQPFSQVDASTTRKYGGSGLGLAICRQLVELMGGDIEVESEPERGTVFRFAVSLPVSDARLLPQTVPPAALDSEMGQKQPLRILLVEDDTVNQKVGVHMLSQLGYRADVAANGLEALDALRRQDYDLVFMDVNMPEMDGLTATQHIQAEWPAAKRPRIIAMTASALEGDRERFLASGMDEYISKPIQIELLAALLQKSASHAQAEPALAEAASGSWPPPTEGGSNAAPVDEAEFSRRLGSGQAALLRTLVALFIDEAARTLPQLRSAVANADAAQTRQFAHHLKGSGAGASAARFALLAHALEQQADGGDLSGAADLVAQLAAELQRVVAWHQSQETAPE